MPQDHLRVAASCSGCRMSPAPHRNGLKVWATTCKPYLEGHQDLCQCLSRVSSFCFSENICTRQKWTTVLAALHEWLQFFCAPSDPTCSAAVFFRVNRGPGLKYGSWTGPNLIANRPYWPQPKPCDFDWWPHVDCTSLEDPHGTQRRWVRPLIEELLAAFE